MAHNGKRFGRWLVVAGPYQHAGSGRGAARRKWQCRCDCGVVRAVVEVYLTSGRSKSCGCARLEAVAAIGRDHRTHGMRDTPEYGVWKSMKQRCLDVNHKTYQFYGGRGITVCERWRDSFQDFYDDMGPRPSESHQIERLDNCGPYAPYNCEWSTRYAQVRNRRSNIYVTIDDVTKCVADWADQFGIPRYRVYVRIRRGMDPIAALEVFNNGNAA